MRSTFRIFAVLCSLTVAISAQDNSSTVPSPTLHANVHLVLAPVTVTDRKGNFIDGLSLDDFVLTDDGVRQAIRMDTSDTVLAPVSLVVAVQCSGISAPAIANINRVGSMIQPLITGERGRAAVIAFDDEIRVFQEFTSDSKKIRAAFARIEGRTIHAGHMIDAIAQGVEMLKTRPENNRRVLLLLSESRDRGSKMKLPDALAAAQRAGVAIYPATYSVYATPWTARPEDNPTMPGGMDLLGAIIELVRKGTVNTADALALATGGHHLSFETLKGLEGTISRAGEEIHSQYLLSFVPQPGKNEGYHRIEVQVPSHSDAVIRARPGYWPE